MPTKTDIKTTTRSHLQSEVNVLVKKYVEDEKRNLWAMADKGHEMYIVHQYKPREVGTMLREGFCQAYEITEKYDAKGKVTNPEYHSFSVTVARVVRVACVDDKYYQQLRNSGRSFYSVWAGMEISPRKIKKIADGEESVDHKAKRAKEELKKEAAEGVVNADTILATFENTSKPKNITKMEKESDAWTAPPKNFDYEWVKESRKICHNDPRLFVRMITSCRDGGLLSDKSLESIREDLGLR
jgi:hypothetical protein